MRWTYFFAIFLYATLSLIAPSGSTWVQTTTLEGGHDHDIWVQEGDTGLDTEPLRGQEPVPPGCRLIPYLAPPLSFMALAMASVMRIKQIRG